jgi:transposase
MPSGASTPSLTFGLARWALQRTARFPKLTNNQAAHKMATIGEAVAAASASLPYLLPYSPDLNPIEQFFAKLKGLLRKALCHIKQPWGITRPSN